jgi:signal transduction histidine kinase
MEMEKKELLDKTFQTVLEVGFGQGNMDLMSDIVASDVVGIGTTVDEMLFGLKDMQDLVKRQREQTVGMEVTYDVNTLDVHISADDNTATLTSEANLYLKVDTNRIEFYIRITAVFEYIQDKWLMVHWHASKPELVESEKDTWGIDSWKQKAEELEKLVAEKTADLVTKNRELEVEAALERVRALTMAMRNSEDVGRCVIKMFTELTALGVDEGTRFGIGILNHDNENNQLWTARKNGEEVNMHIGNIDMTLHPLLKSVREAWKEQVPLHKYVLEGQDLLDYYQMLNNAPDYKIQITIEKLPKKEIQHCFIFEHGFFYAFSPREFQPELIHITQRFSALFEQTYRRYLDLVKAEAQAREAHIEAALEKVRSRSLAMHTSSELNEVVKVLFEKLTELQVPSTAVGIQTFIEGSNDMQAFVCGDVGTGIVINQYRLPYFDHPIVHDYINAHKNKLEVFVGNYSKKEKDSFYDVIVKLPELHDLAAEVKTMIYESDFYEVTIVPAERSLIAVNDFQGNPLTESQVNILKRFAKVFDQTYTRFLDLQKAEEQAREAQIEAALERVRSRTMAMQSSAELGAVAAELFAQMNQLVSNLWTCGFVLCEKDRNEDEWWLSMDGDFTRGFFLPNVGDYAHATLYEGWIRGEALRAVQLDGETLQQHYDWLMEIPVSRAIFEEMDAAGLARPDWQKLHAAYFSKGYLVLITREPSEEEEIFRRFAQVFDQTYTRFLDLQKAEAQAKEAQIELSLERIRSQVTAMQESSDLLDIVVTMRNEFVKLGHEAHYFWHMRWLPDRYDKAMTSGDGSKIGMVMTLPRHIHGDIKLVADWEKTKEPTVVLAMDVEMAIDYIQKMITLGDFEQVDPQALTLDDIRHIGGLTFVMARTTHGEIGFSLPGMVPNPPKKTMDTLVRFAGVFDLAYKRFEDLKAAEKDLIEIKAARLKAEEALTELKATQSQLIQSEKMASLGELTAGIAHEIQNPLNFVNNFSEVSTELVAEMNAELDKGNTVDAKEIANDLKQNLDKINHHGKRAADIVKGMLQHSRSSSGIKEPTDIKALSDEYLRLAYHGLRAKDKSFNATMKTDFDESIGNINIIPQDIGRVILNLITNAFYVVAEKKKQNPEGYEPTVIVSSRKVDGKVEVSVKDNGSGIPQNVLDKIFQPFFTTKPTGQGTGLGLSLSYDIVKAHGGELKVETNEGEGSEFIIQLPIV